MHLSREIKRNISQAAEGEAGMSRREAAPPIVQNVVRCFSAHINTDKSVFWSSRDRLAACDQIRAWSADSVLDHVSDEEGKHDAADVRTRSWGSVRAVTLLGVQVS